MDDWKQYACFVFVKAIECNCGQPLVIVMKVTNESTTLLTNPKLKSKLSNLSKIKLFVGMQMYAAKHIMELMKLNTNYPFTGVFSIANFIII